MSWHFRWYLIPFAACLLGTTSGQLAEIAQVVTGAQTLVPGVKNIMSGLLAADKVHNKCMQQTLCHAFSGKLVESKVEFDPVKRSVVVVPKVIREEGKLRWIGDLIVNLFKSVGRRMGIDRMFNYYENRRQIGAPNPLIVQVINFGLQMFKQIPAKQIHNVMNAVVDYTNIMDTEGPVYPFVRSATLGYGFGNEVDERDDSFKGVCQNLGDDCPDSMWDHLGTANDDYSVRIGKISERNAAPSNDIVRQRVAEGQEVDFNTWNFMEPKDLLNPRVFLCKTGRFIQNVVTKNMKNDEDTEVKMETFVNSDFQNSCQEKDLDNLHTELADHEGSGDCTTYTDAENDAVIVSNSDLVSSNNKCKPQESVEETTEDSNVDFSENEINSGSVFEDRSSEDFPVLVFEGLPRPQSSQTEEDLIAQVLAKSSNLSPLAVRRAVRLPVLQESNLKSLVLVELDTVEHEQQVLNDKDAIEKQRKVEVRRAKYQELWRFVADLTVVNRMAVPERAIGVDDTVEKAAKFKVSQDKDPFPSTALPPLQSTLPRVTPPGLLTTTLANDEKNDTAATQDDEVVVQEKSRRMFWWF